VTSVPRMTLTRAVGRRGLPTPAMGLPSTRSSATRCRKKAFHELQARWWRLWRGRWPRRRRHRNALSSAATASSSRATPWAVATRRAVPGGLDGRRRGRRGWARPPTTPPESPRRQGPAGWRPGSSQLLELLWREVGLAQDGGQGAGGQLPVQRHDGHPAVIVAELGVAAALGDPGEAGPLQGSTTSAPERRGNRGLKGRRRPRRGQ
jgi:hypothetical protein